MPAPSVFTVHAATQRHLFPFSAIVGQEPLRTALLINAVDPTVGGVLVRGHKGSAKTTAVRALARLLPSIDLVEGCPFRCAPDAPSPLHPECWQKLARGEELPVGRAPMPLVELPLGATEDRLVGTLHLEHALQQGERRFEPGLLAAAHRGILYVDEVNLLEDHLVDLLLDVAASGVNTVEREGLSVQHEARLLLVGTMNPEEGELRPQLLDRFGLCVEVRGLSEPADREAVVVRRLTFERDPAAFVAHWAGADNRLQSTIARARAALARVEVPIAELRLAVRLAAAADTDGHRAEIAMLKAARALAALNDHVQVERAELAQAAKLALPHRLGQAPIGTADDVAGRIDELLATALDSGSALPSSSLPALADEAILQAEAMQVPGSSAAGSVLFVVEKKSSQNGSSTPTSSSA